MQEVTVEIRSITEKAQAIAVLNEASTERQAAGAVEAFGSSLSALRAREERRFVPKSVVQGACRDDIGQAVGHMWQLFMEYRLHSSYINKNHKGQFS